MDNGRHTTVNLNIYDILLPTALNLNSGRCI